MLLAPPMINGHTHAAMTLFRGFGDDLPLMEWLETKIWPAEAKVQPDDVYWGARLAAIEMIRSGTSKFFDMYWHSPDAARAATEAGLRCVASAVYFDPPDGDDQRMRALALEWIEELSAAGPLVTPSIGPHAIYTVSRDSLAWIAEQRSERDLPLQIHLSETEQEVADCLEAHGKRPAAYLDELGLLGPQTALAHGVWLDESELELIAERGATIVSCPAANMKLAVGGVFPYPQASAASVAIGLGSDGVSSNNNLDLFEEAKLLSLLQKHHAANPAVLPASEALAVARGRRSPLMGGTPLKAGMPADFLLLRSDIPEMSAGDVEANLVYAAPGTVVDTTVVAGRVLMRGREIPAAEEATAEVRARAKKLTG
jgi:5-methylthioadenosine/S-adenosylhomocysteine deaminase